MKKKLLPLPPHIKTFLFIAFLFSAVCWFGAWFLANQLDTEILVNQDIGRWRTDSKSLFVSLLFTVATLGPFIAAMAVRQQSNITWRGKGLQYLAIVIGLVGGIQLLLNGIARFIDYEPAGYRIGFVLFTLIYFALTSGTEEFGWRGVLYPHIRDNSKNLWESAFVTGIIWGIWHTPFMLYNHFTNSVDATSPAAEIAISFLVVMAGFIMTMVLWSFFHGWINVRGGSTVANYLLHTIGNWLAVPLAMLFGLNNFSIFIVLASLLVGMLVLEKLAPSQQYFEDAAAIDVTTH